MPIDLDAAVSFLLANGRLLDRRRLDAARDPAARGAVLDALRPYRNADGGFGHALEPDVRGPGSEPTAAFHALEVLAEAAALDDPLVVGLARWVGSVAGPDGGVPFVSATAGRYPHAPWMVPSEGGSHLTFALAGALGEAGVDDPWLARGTSWCWSTLEEPAGLGAYLVKFALGFLDRVPDGERATTALDALRPRLGPDGTMAVEGGTADERLRPLDLSPRPGLRSRRLFTEGQIAADLDELEGGQQEDGGWTFDWLAWSPGQAAEWRGAVTLRALLTLEAHGRVRLRADG